MNMVESALFLDRDGINVDRGYVHRPGQFEFVPGIFQLARFWTKELHRPIIVVSNQSGIGRGYFDEKAHADLCDSFEAEGAAVARVTLPLSPSAWHRRVPSRSSVAQAQAWHDPAGDLDLAFDPQMSDPGDKISDMEAGVAAGLGLRILLDARADRGKNHVLGHEVVANLGEALELLRSRFAHAASGSAST